jgi:regulator of replication initiation timing
MYKKTIHSLKSTIASMSRDAQDQMQSLEEEMRMLRVQHTEQVSSLLRENSSMRKELRRLKEREQTHVVRDEEKPITSYTGKTKQKSKPKIVIPMAASVSQDMTSPPGYSPLAAGRLMHYNSTP